MIKVFKRYLALLSATQRRWAWLTALTIIMVMIARFAFDSQWFTIIIVLTFFASKELYDYGRRRANAKAPWK